MFLFVNTVDDKGGAFVRLPAEYRMERDLFAKAWEIFVTCANANWLPGPRSRVQVLGQPLRQISFAKKALYLSRCLRRIPVMVRTVSGVKIHPSMA